jgi:hypothetical protein
VLLSDDHLREDVISNRIFEISSVGAVSVCPDIPWIRKWFGDSVLYLPRGGTVKECAAAVAGHREWCRIEPEAAQVMADRARDTFEQHFAAERMLTNLVEYHHQKRARRARGEAHAQPQISVIVRCGGRSPDMVEAALRSIERQSFGRFTVVLSKYKDIDLGHITSGLSGAVEAWRDVLTPGGNRVETLFAGLRSVTTDYFAILDYDDFWLDDHVETLFAATRLVDPAFDVAFSGSVCISASATEIETNVFWNRNIDTFGFAVEPRNLADVTVEFSSNCFVARTDLMKGLLDDLPDLRSAEDSLVVALLCRRRRPVFSYKPTAFFRRGWDGESAYASDPSRSRDVRSVLLRSGLLHQAQWLGSGSLPSSSGQWLAPSAPGEDGRVRRQRASTTSFAHRFARSSRPAGGGSVGR